MPRICRTLGHGLQPSKPIASDFNQPRGAHPRVGQSSLRLRPPLFGGLRAARLHRPSGPRWCCRLQNGGRGICAWQSLEAKTGCADRLWSSRGGQPERRPPTPPKPLSIWHNGRAGGHREQKFGSDVRLRRIRRGRAQILMSRVPSPNSSAIFQYIEKAVHGKWHSYCHTKGILP